MAGAFFGDVYKLTFYLRLSWMPTVWWNEHFAVWKNNQRMVSSLHMYHHNEKKQQLNVIS